MADLSEIPGMSNRARGRVESLRVLCPQEFCEFSIEETDDETGESYQRRCVMYPRPANCLRCSESMAMEITIHRAHRLHPNGEVRLMKKRHCTRVHFLDEGENGRDRKNLISAIADGQAERKV